MYLSESETISGICAVRRRECRQAHRRPAWPDPGASW